MKDFFSIAILVGTATCLFVSFCLFLVIALDAITKKKKGDKK